MKICFINQFVGICLIASLVLSAKTDKSSYRNGFGSATCFIFLGDDEARRRNKREKVEWKPSLQFHGTNNQCRPPTAKKKRKNVLDNLESDKIAGTRTDFVTSNVNQMDQGHDVSRDEKDTVRVRIWRSLATNNGQELTLQQLGAMVGERNLGDLRSHLTHVERQAKTFRNKSDEWKKRRGLVLHDSDGKSNVIQKVKLKRWKGDRGIMFIRLQI
mmetsp:Transcript_29144/g.44065  ORF Transcript_29144/g.44065 Transcript_29144/m.44065 type:complete len:215 (+) Transcript_29144:79-723(+)